MGTKLLLISILLESKSFIADGCSDIISFEIKSYEIFEVLKKKEFSI